MGGEEFQLLSLLNSAIYRGGWPVSRRGRLTPLEKAPPPKKKILKVAGWATKLI